jgi:hypothetical protein
MSCQSGKTRKTMQIIREWTGKTIVFPDIKPFCLSANDSLFIPSNQYKILFYSDSLGCTQCSLRLLEWKSHIEDIGSKADFLFYIHPKTERTLLLDLKSTKFNYPVFIDTANLLYNTNKLPDNPMFQCFLLDQNNKILAIGNPTRNPHIWELYKEIITGKPAEQQPLTTIEAEQTEIVIKDLQTGKTSEAVFRLKNTGGNPLAVIMVESSCGCTVPEWEKEPVAAGKTTEIKVKIRPEKREFFHKTVTVHCNTEGGRIVLNIKGSVEK